MLIFLNNLHYGNRRRTLLIMTVPPSPCRKPIVSNITDISFLIGVYYEEEIKEIEIDKNTAQIFFLIIK